jgi:hypothetical protein
MHIPGPYRPVIGIRNLDTYYFSIHAASGNNQGGDAWRLLNSVRTQVNGSWWVAGDYNQEPNRLESRLNSNNVNVTVCPPNAITRPQSSNMLDYAVRDNNAQEIVGEVSNAGPILLSDHLPVFYPL